MGVVLARRAIEVAPYSVAYRERTLRVPPTWPSLEILHLSDLHLRRSDTALLRAQKAALKRLDRQPDLVCVTGDVCEKVDDVPMVAELLRLLRPRLGTFVILGNHEYGAGAPHGGPPSEKLMSRAFFAVFGPRLSSGSCEAEAIATALAGHGVCVLRNQGLRLLDGETSLWLAGVDDGWAGRADVGKALAGRQPGEGALALIHEPELAFEAVEHGADVVLAGHTHGGQVSLPIIGAPIWHRMDPRLDRPAGIQAIGKAQLHISAGTGQLVPLRFRCPPEVVWLHCRPLLT
jgi:predicted MPP superfamily phosphohydrolase